MEARSLFMRGMADLTQAEQLAAFAVEASYGDLSEEARRQTRLLVLDSIGCALGSLGAEPIRSCMDRQYKKELPRSSPGTPGYAFPKFLSCAPYVSYRQKPDTPLGESPGKFEPDLS